MALGIFTKFFGSGPWDLAQVQPPWGTRPSIFEHLRTHPKAMGGTRGEGGEAHLPDEAPEGEDGGIRWAAGALDGVMGHHGGDGDQAKVADDVLRALTRASRSASQSNIDALYAVLKANNTLGFVDPFIEKVRGNRDLQSDRVHSLATWLATKAADREPVKAGIALLGVFPKAADDDLLLTLGQHEEFTVFAAVAIANSSPRPEPTLWTLAKSVDGWGRIQTVERLAKTSNPAIKAWLVRDGYKNSVMYEYLAYTCAVSGGLETELAKPEIDDALFNGAGEILATLIDGQGGPAEGIDDYEHGVTAIAQYLRHAQRRAQTLAHFLAVKSIEGFLNGTEGWDKRTKAGWTPEVRQRLLTESTEVLSRPEWKDRTLESLKSKDRVEFWNATRAATALGMDPWDEYFTRVSAGEDYWFQLFQTKDQGRLGRALELASNKIPLDQIATGPARQMGLGPAFAHHSHLDFVLQELARFPRQGWPFIKAGMKSPVIRNRNMAIRALGAWPRAEWPTEAEGYARGCAANEPDEKVRAWFEKLIAGQPLE